jgi:hypothetical protein
MSQPSERFHLSAKPGHSFLAATPALSTPAFPSDSCIDPWHVDVPKTRRTIPHRSDDEVDVIGHDAMHVELATRLCSLFQQAEYGYVRETAVLEGSPLL